MGFKVTLKTSRSCVSDYNFNCTERNYKNKLYPLSFFGAEGETRAVPGLDSKVTSWW